MKFTKMHGLGNDFIIINTLDNVISPNHLLPIKKLSHRHLGIGFDQLLLIAPSSHADFSCRIFNSDGSEAEQCGNGIRCVARFIHEEKLSLKNTMSIETKAGISEIIIHDYDHIQVTMGVPDINNLSISLTLDDPIFQQKGHFLNIAVLSLGNPHTILQVPCIESCPINQWGLKISNHSSFPNGTNIGFMEIVTRQHIRLRTYERGAGMTFACGSNACAAVVAGITNNLLDNQVKVELFFGDLEIKWQGNHNPVFMTGPAARVFDGYYI